LIPNDFGLFDLYGNVSEWTANLYENGHVLIAGGSFGMTPEKIESNYVSPTKPDLLYNSYGFRVVRTIELDENGRPK
jgi:formylglycine-generating enzyme required for sulfatase activity